MGMLRRLLSARELLPFAMLMRRAAASLAGLVVLASMGPAGAADIVAPEVEPSSYTYLAIEGGYVHFEAEDVQAFLFADDPQPGSGDWRERSLDISDGYYGRAELGRVWNTGLINGIGAYVQGWDGDDEDISQTEFGMQLAYKHEDETPGATNVCIADFEPCAHGEAELDRSLIEAGLRLFHAYGETVEHGGVTLGIEPFVAFIDEDTSSTVGAVFQGQFGRNGTRAADLDGTAYGALVALDGRHFILERTVLITRAAAGAYYIDAGADTVFIFHPTDSPDDTLNHELSEDIWGLRGQLALGLEQMLSDTFSVGVIGRLDYWSDFPSIEWTDFDGSGDPADASDNKIASEDFLALSIGARVSIHFR